MEKKEKKKRNTLKKDNMGEKVKRAERERISVEKEKAQGEEGLPFPANFWKAEAVESPWGGFARSSGKGATAPRADTIRWEARLIEHHRRPVSVFCIHDIKTDKAYYYVYSEKTTAKTPNEVCTSLMQYENYLPKNVTELRLFDDNCPRQNKNHCMVRFSMALVETGRFKKVEQIFPVRGHSILTCDRDFGVIKRSLKKYDRLYDLHS
nr:unnamed protein product [Callosobruchus chinensis]